MERREFLKCSGKVCGGMLMTSLIGVPLLSSCGISGRMLKTKVEADGKVRLDLTLLEDMKFKIVRIAGYDFDIGVQKLETASYRVLILLCPHANQPVTKAGDGYVCTMHGSRFRADGSVSKGPSSDPMPVLNYELSEKEILFSLL